MLPPARTFSAVDIFDTSKPDEPEPSMHRSFQPPRARAPAAPHPLSKRGPVRESNTPQGTAFRREARDRPHRRDRPADGADPGTPGGLLERGWERDREHRPDATAAPRRSRASPSSWSRGLGTTTPPREERRLRGPRSSTTGRSGPMHRARDRRRPSSSRDRSWPRRPRRLRDRPSTGGRRSGLRWDGQLRVAQLRGQALGTDHTASDRDRAGEADRFLARAAAGDGRSARMMDAPLVGDAAGRLGARGRLVALRVPGWRAGAPPGSRGSARRLPRR